MAVPLLHIRRSLRGGIPASLTLVPGEQLGSLRSPRRRIGRTPIIAGSHRWSLRSVASFRDEHLRRRTHRSADPSGRADPVRRVRRRGAVRRRRLLHRRARSRSSGSRLRHQPRDRPALRRPGRPGARPMLGRPRRARSVLRGRGRRAAAGAWPPTCSPRSLGARRRCATCWSSAPTPAAPSSVTCWRSSRSRTRSARCTRAPTPTPRSPRGSARSPRRCPISPPSP